MPYTLPGPNVPGLLVPQWLLISISLAVIIARLNLRLRVQQTPLTASDYLMCCAWLSAVATASFDIVFAQMGVITTDMDYFLMAYEGPPEDIEFILKMQWASQFPFYLTFYFAKAALLAIYVRLFPVFMRKRRFILWTVIIYCAVAFGVTILTTLFICQPFEAYWSLDPDIACAPSRIIDTFIISWSLHFAGDVMIFVLPFLILYHLQMKTRLKAGVFCTFLIGIINIAFCLTRFLTLNQSSATSVPSFSLVELWSALDCNISVLVACLPSLRPYLRGSQWKPYASTKKLRSSGKSATSSKFHMRGSVSNGSAVRRICPDEGFTFSEEEHPYAVTRNSHLGMAPKDQIISTSASADRDDQLDDISGKHSTGGSDIELVAQKSRSLSYAVS